MKDNYSDYKDCDIKISKDEWIRIFGSDGKSGLCKTISTNILKSGYYSSYIRNDIEELNQMVVQNVLKLIPEYRTGTKSLTSWLYEYGFRRTIQSIAREYGKHMRDTNDEMLVDVPSRENIIRKLQDRSLIRRILDVCDKDDLKIVLMKISEYSNDEICEILKINKMRIYRTFDKIRNKI